MSESILQACELARHQSGLALAALIDDVLQNPKIYVFGELLSVPSVALLSQLNPQDADNASLVKSYKTLELFAFGTYMDYKSASSAEKFLSLTSVMAYKLKQLSLISMAEKERVLAYDHMQKQLDISSVRELEDLIIDSIYSNLITGKMNQSQGRLSVSSFIGRDVRMEEIGDIIQKLQAFKNMCSQQVNSIVDCSKQVRDQREMMEYQQASVIESVNRNKEDIKAAYLAASANIARSGVIGGGGRFV